VTAAVVVADASPLIALQQISQLQLLQTLFAELTEVLFRRRRAPLERIRLTMSE